VKSEQDFPSPRLLREIKVWDRRDLDHYFDRLPNLKNNAAQMVLAAASDWDD
jgi:hypothetical protein